jgi:D-alanine-D-alanine ligase
MKILLLHNKPSQDAAVEDFDVLTQRDAVAAALGSLGHDVHSLACTLNLSAVQRQLKTLQPDAAFNLVESLARTDRLMGLATLLLEGLEIPFTGSGTTAILSSSNKVEAKQKLCAAGLPTAPWQTDEALRVHADAGHAATICAEFPSRWIIKPIWEHASLGMDDGAVVSAEAPADLAHSIAERSSRIGRPHFAEKFIAGREFNLSLLANLDARNDEDPVQVLAPAEIDFSMLPVGSLQIVGHKAKWDEASPEYQLTPRRFEFPAADEPLLLQLQSLARACWTLFGMRGYARVDFRVDETGQPWILEVNANPCLSPDAGFSAAIEQSGLTFQGAVSRILADVSHF